MVDLRTLLDKHMLPIFGSQKLDRITAASVERFRDGLRDRADAPYYQHDSPDHERGLSRTGPTSL